MMLLHLPNNKRGYVVSSLRRAIPIPPRLFPPPSKYSASLNLPPSYILQPSIRLLDPINFSIWPVIHVTRTLRSSRASSTPSRVIILILLRFELLQCSDLP